MSHYGPISCHRAGLMIQNMTSTPTSNAHDGMVECKNGHVIIIGAGIAGLAAAEKLTGNKVRVTIVEATSRPGGRIHSVPFGNGISEQGATWIHGIDDNPVYQCIANKNIAENSKSSSRSKGEVYCYSDGQTLSKDYVNEVESVYYKCVDKIANIAENSGPVDYSKSFGDVIQQELDDYTQKKSDDEKALIADIWRSCLNRECSYSGCDCVCDMMLQDYGEYKEMNGLWPIFPKGYSQVIHTLLEKIPEGCLLLNSPVKSVHWNQCDFKDGLRRGANNVKVELTNGSTISADYVIVTVSLGVLKENHLNMFQPNLSKEKQSAIKRLGFGTVNNISMEFGSQFWREKDLDFIRVMWRDDKKYAVKKNPKQEWFRKIFTFYESPHNPDVLICWLAGSESRHMETVSDEEVIQTCTDILRNCFNDQSIPKPKAFLRTQWYSNPYSRGSYSYVAVGSQGADVDMLAEPVLVDGIPVVLFAGEATHRHYYSTTHGAMMSGYREAHRLLKHLGIPL